MGPSPQSPSPAITSATLPWKFSPDTGRGNWPGLTHRLLRLPGQMGSAMRTAEASLSPSLPQSLKYCHQHFVSCHHQVQSSMGAPRPSLSHLSEPGVPCRSRHSPFPVGGHPESPNPISSEDETEAHGGPRLAPNHSAGQRQSTEYTSPQTGALQGTAPFLRCPHDTCLASGASA